MSVQEVRETLPATDAGRAVLIAGPTASGKSALALRLAEKAGGVIINTDSMQVYRDLRIITARPTPDEEARVPHRLYGHRDAAINCSVGTWLDDAAAALAEARSADRLPIFIGGTGLYFKALLRGLSSVPPVPGEIREAVRARLERDGIEALHAELARRDPVMGERLKPRDRARVARALEVIEATGRSISDWHAHGLPPLLSPANVTAVFLAPERAELYARIDRRFASDAGRRRAGGGGGAGEARPRSDPAGDEGARRARADPPPAGRDLARGGGGRSAPTDTRHYAKRQFTWFRHQLPEFEWIAPDDAPRRLEMAG